jgi:hypothetical protein
MLEARKPFMSKLAVPGLALAVMFLGSAAFAHGHNWGHGRVFVSVGVPIVAPAPVYYAPPPVVYGPMAAPVYYPPPAVVYGPVAPYSYYYPPSYGGISFSFGGHGYGHGHGHHR